MINDWLFLFGIWLLDGGTAACDIRARPALGVEEPTMIFWWLRKRREARAAKDAEEARQDDIARQEGWTRGRCGGMGFWIPSPPPKPIPWALPVYTDAIVVEDNDTCLRYSAKYSWRLRQCSMVFLHCAA